MKTLTPEAIFVAPFNRVITAPIAPHCHIDTPEPLHAIALHPTIALNTDHEADQYFITLQKLATYQSSLTRPDWMTLELTLELQRLAQPAKPRIEDWVSEHLPGWHITDWAMPEPNDEFEAWPGHHVAISGCGSIAIAQGSGPSSVAIADSYPVNAIAQASGHGSIAIAQASGPSINAIAEA